MRGRGLRPRRRVAADTDGSIGGGSDAATHDWYTICQSRFCAATALIPQAQTEAVARN